MGEVYLARDTRLDRTVAVKVLPEHLSGNAELRERFEREARTVLSLKHPHICALYDVGSQDDIDYLVMEHREGETLAERLTRGPLPLAQALSRAIEIADTLDKVPRRPVQSSLEKVATIGRIFVHADLLVPADPSRLPGRWQRDWVAVFDWSKEPFELPIEGQDDVDSWKAVSSVDTTMRPSSSVTMLNSAASPETSERDKAPHE